MRPQLFVLTQWNSNALNQHIHLSFPPTTFGTAQARGFVDVLTANQTPRSTSWCGSNLRRVLASETLGSHGFSHASFSPQRCGAARDSNSYMS